MSECCKPLSNIERAVYLSVLAQELDGQYPDRPFVALGHSGSWLVSAIGMLRQQQGRTRNTSYIPFTGEFFRFDRENRSNDTISFKPHDIYDVSQNSLNRYFSQLAKTSVDPASLKAKLQGNANVQKPILVDVVSRGGGVASFADSFMANRSDKDAEFLDFFDVVAFKLHYDDKSVIFDYDSFLNEGERHQYPVQIISGRTGLFFDGLAGVKGKAASYNTDNESSVARFMPYYSVIDGYNQESYAANYEAPISALNAVKEFSPQVRSMKCALREAFRMDAAKKNDMVQDIEHRLNQDLERRACRLRTQERYWIPPFRGMHG